MNWGITCFFENRQEFAKVAELAPLYPINYLEIRGERPFFSPEDLTKQTLEFFKEVIRKSGLKVTLHATFYDINLSTINSYLRDATIQCYKKYVDLAAELRAEVMVVHAGYIHKDAAEIEKIQTMASRHLIENLRILGDYAASRGVVIGLENSPPNPNHLMIAEWNRHREILERTDHDHVRAVLDVAHAFLQGLDIDHYYGQIEDYLAELHVHNNNGKEDLHQAIDLGEIDYAHFFKNRVVRVPVIMEIRNLSEAIQSLEWIKKQHV
ncbi:MAG: sugar phosphate isomerase/epimerase [bacterium]|nr:MAG: sugar phosphate isomerase/epimerase [bacterium]